MAPTPHSAAAAQAGTRELPVGATFAMEGNGADGCITRSGDSAGLVLELLWSVPASDPVDEAEVRLMLEMQHQGYVARRALEELFESGEAECLSI